MTTFFTKPVFDFKALVIVARANAARRLTAAAVARRGTVLWLAGMLMLACALFAPSPARAQFTQQGPKLIGGGEVGSGDVGSAVALSADGNTAIVGGDFDNSGVGAVWFYSRSDGVWTQQGPKVVGADIQGQAFFGTSVALSADGNTAIVGGSGDNSGVGATWIYTRSGSVWTQQGAKLIGSGANGSARQGVSVSLSADSDTALVGGTSDNAATGAAWVFTRGGGVWTQQGPKLVGTGAAAQTNLGSAVALSADGTTAVIGGFGDNLSTGATWIFTRSGGVWTQQGAKLIGTGAGGAAGQGQSVAVSGDGNTAVVGGNSDNSNVGAAWVFTRSGGSWTQQGAKLVGTGAVGNGQQGRAVALSADGNTALVGGWLDNASQGATWVYTRSGGVWTQQGAKLVGTGVSNSARQGFAVALSANASTAAVGGPVDGNPFKGAAWIFGQPILAVSPATDILASGNLGGPFTPSSFDFILTAPSSAVNYTITGVPNWLTASSTSGTISGAPVTVTFTVNASANLLAAGVYGPSTVTFTNTASGLGNTTRSATLTVGPVPATSLMSAVLPGSRSVQVGNRASAFATVINTGASGGVNCGLALGTAIAGSTFDYQTTDPNTNVRTGTVNTPVAIAAGGSQTYVFGITPSTALNPTDVPISATCGNAPAPVVLTGVNTLLLSASTSPVPDIVALAATASGDGILTIPGTGASGAFAVASVNVGAAAAITVSADTGATSLPVTIDLCQTDSSTAACVTPRSPSLSFDFAANATPTFSIFVKANGTLDQAQVVAFDPATNRVFVRFKDAGGVTRGSTSVAVRTQ